MSPIEIAGAVASFLGIWLTARRSLLCWPVSLIACGLYFKVFLDVRLYADMVLQALFAVAIGYGWHNWVRGKQDAGTVRVVPLRAGQAACGLAVGAIGAVAIGSFTSRYTDAALPWMDATLTSFSLVAQYWTARRHSASWLLWIVVDLVYVGMFVAKGLTLTAVLYATMVGLAVAGYRGWRRAASQTDSGHSAAA